MDSLFSFPVGLFHPLQHAGLSRRTPVGRRPGRNGAKDWVFLRELGMATPIDQSTFAGPGVIPEYGTVSLTAAFS